MKRLAVFCDGTWNRLSAEHPTNVVLAARSVLPYGTDGVPQVTYYDEGVGTTFLINQALERTLAGAFGWGLFDKIAAAYRFLVFNYDPGDEIYIFGFSRGAFTARSLAGLIRKCGIVTRDRLDKVEEAFKFYKDNSPEAHPDMERAQQFRLENSQDIIMKPEDRAFRQALGVPAALTNQPLFTLKYLGVWDTVGALGMPRYLLLERIFRTAAKYQFHDAALSSIVEAARHAVAIDEDRLSFEPALWDNVDDLNRIEGRAGNYHQLWFPGDHGSVGGGGDITGLSASPLVWIMDGASRQGLAFDRAALKAYAGERDDFAPLHNMTAPKSWTEIIYRRGARKGPWRQADLGASSRARIARTASADWPIYRPAALSAFFERQSQTARRRSEERRPTEPSPSAPS
ncbi:DUF2235 domain-containing protein [Paradevosia shaoguanensis]|uniref:DUF2235 domain-containing protein n=1 Tax=Paradevosia shaoguanensis TaxID=1335043 RepID=UPI001932C2F8|nr:DUF2235 domain-containing protein [Paradevosia shaoguanensis]